MSHAGDGLFEHGCGCDCRVAPSTKAIKAEQEAIEKYLMAWWRMILSSFKKPQDSLDVIEYLDSIQHITHDLTPYLTAWRQMQTVSALRHLADFVLCGGIL